MLAYIHTTSPSHKILILKPYTHTVPHFSSPAQVDQRGGIRNSVLFKEKGLLCQHSHTAHNPMARTIQPYRNNSRSVALEFLVRSTSTRTHSLKRSLQILEQKHGYTTNDYAILQCLRIKFPHEVRPPLMVENQWF